MDLSELPKVRGEYRLGYNLSHLTWFKVGGNADVFFKPKDLDDLAFLLKENKKKLPITVIGAGSNLIIRDGGVEGIVIKLGRAFTNIEILNDNELSVGAGCLNYNLAKFAENNGFANFEFLIGIPGTIGGGIAMNAGAYGMEFKDIVKQVEFVDQQGNISILENKDIGFSYRANKLPPGLIFTRVIFDITKGNAVEISKKMQKIISDRNNSQPIKEKTGGSTFANPEGKKVWQLIDQVGLRGYRIGGAVMSQKHCNFMINEDNATAADLENLGDFVKEKVKNITSIELKWEIKRIGKKDN